jgi:hypothetical protein
MEPRWSRICRLLKRQQILTTFASSIDYGVGPEMDLKGATNEAPTGGQRKKALDV